MNKETMEQWMERRSKDWEDPLDLAAECSLTYGIWNDDYSVPDQVIAMAKSYYTKNI